AVDRDDRGTKPRGDEPRSNGEVLVVVDRHGREQLECDVGIIRTRDQRFMSAGRAWRSAIIRAREEALRADGESGGIGRRTSLRSWRDTPWGFESPLSHQATSATQVGSDTPFAARHRKWCLTPLFKEGPTHADHAGKPGPTGAAPERRGSSGR